MTDREYKKLREDCVSKFSIALEHTFVFQALKVDPDTIARLMKDEEYIVETKAIIAELHIEHIAQLRSVMTGEAENYAKGSSQAIMKAVQMQRDILSLDVDKQDNENTLNIIFTQQAKEDFEEDPNVVIFNGEE